VPLCIGHTAIERAMMSENLPAERVKLDKRLYSDLIHGQQG
jgi:hypothetical protein